MAAMLFVVAAGPQSRGERGWELPARARDWRAGINPRNTTQHPANHLWPVAWFVEAISSGVGNAAGRARISDPDRAEGSMAVLALGALSRACGTGSPGRVHVRDAAGRRTVLFPGAKVLLERVVGH